MNFPPPSRIGKKMEMSMDIKMNKKNTSKGGWQVLTTVPSGYMVQWGKKEIQGKTEGDI